MVDDALEVLWSLISLLVHFYQVLRRVIPMALHNSPVPWKRFSESSALTPKRRKEFYDTKDSISTQNDCTGENFGSKKEAEDHASVRMVELDSSSSMKMVSEAKVPQKVRKRPARIVVPESCVSLGFGEVGKEEGLVKEGFEVEGSEYWLACRKGRRHEMEDGYGVITNINGDPKQAFFGVFDGHGGRAAVDFVSEKLGKNIIAALSELEEDDPLELAMRAGYLTTDREFLSQGVSSGACAATVLLKDGELLAANVGDCRVVISNKGIADALTSDHRVGREDEHIRIESSGGYVSCRNGVWRVQDSLAVSRAIGDASMKEWVISEPETTRLCLTPHTEFLIIASDGLWDKVTDQEAVDVILRHKKSIESCKELVDTSSSRGSRDDITVMVVDLQRFLYT